MHRHVVVVVVIIRHMMIFWGAVQLVVVIVVVLLTHSLPSQRQAKTANGRGGGNVVAVVGP
jgi:hypothetical protein